MIYYNIAIRKKLLFVIFLSIFSYTVAGANNLNIIKVNAQTSTINLFNYIDILEDKDNNLTIENIIKGRYENLFTPASVTGNSFGFSKSAYWIRFSIQIDKNVEESLYLELSYPLMDYATLYIPHKDGSFTEKKAGELIPISIKEVDHRNHLFSVPKNFNTVQTYYMYVKSDASMQVPLKLLTSSTLVEQIDKVNFILGGYYGNMVLLMIFSFIAYLKIKDKLFFSYTIYLLSYLLFQLSMNGFLYQYFFPFPLEYSNKFNALSLGFVIFGATLFSGHFLQIWEREYFKIRLLFYSLIVGAFLGVLVAFTISHSLGVKIAAIVGMLLPLVIMFGAIYSLYTGYKPARFFLIAWSIFLLGIFIGVTAVVGLIGLGAGLEAAVGAQFGISSTEVITVQAGGVNAFGAPGSGAVNKLTTDDAEEIEKLSSVEMAIPRNIETIRVEYNDKLSVMSALSVPYGEKKKKGWEVMDIEAEKGRLLQDSDLKKVVLGNSFSENSNGFDKAIETGDKILINDEKFEVVGILKKKGSLIFDNVVFVNNDVLEDLTGYGNEVDLIAVTIKNPELMDKAAEDITKLLRKQRDVKEGEENFEVSTPEAMMETVNSILGGVQAFIIIIASISILVGAIGIVNTKGLKNLTCK